MPSFFKSSHRCLFVLLAMLAAGLVRLAAAPQLSEQAEVSLLVCSPGEELYSVFGHAALRVHDPLLNIDHVYNYGTFDFDEPNFYWRFLGGNLRYKLAREPFRLFKRSYVRRNRAVDERILDFSPAEKQGVFDLVETNLLPENRYYKYDFLFDNCATRLRDIVRKGVDGTLVFDGSHLKEPKTFRNLLDEYLVNSPVSDFGIDIALGKKLERRVEPEEYMFLPDYLGYGFDNAYVEKGGERRPLVKSKENMVPRTPRPEEDGFVPKPLHFTLLLCLLAVVLTFAAGKRKGVRFLAFDVVYFFLIGLIGVAVAALWLLSEYPTTKGNLNLLWACPLFVVVALLLPFHKKMPWLKYFFLVAAIINLGLLLLYKWFPQQYHVAFLPLMATTVIRSVYLYLNLSPKTKAA